jgi:hypothetical protein
LIGIAYPLIEEVARRMRRGEVATNSLGCAARMQSCDDVLDRRDPGDVQTP